MKPGRISFALLVVFLLLAPALFAQSSDSPNQSAASFAAETSTEVPRLIKFSGTLLDERGHAMAGPVGVTFALYAQQSGGATLWLETQNVKPDANGDYIVLLGANSARGVPLELFTSGEARWLGVQPEGQIEQPRVLLVSVPYALKAGDAETLGGKPASAFALTGSLAESAGNAPVSQTIVAPFMGATTPGFSADSASAAASACTTITADGTAPANQVAKFSGPCQIHQSLLSDNGATVSVAGAFNYPAVASATSTLGQNSFSSNFTASSFSSSTHLPVNQNFRWQAEPTGNNTSSPSGKLNLLFASGTGTPAETGLHIASNGQITFAAGQTFPGTGPGSVKSVALTAPSSDFSVSGSPVTGSGTLGFAWKVAPTNAATANAIVKRDALGSFQVNSITASGGITSASLSTGNAFLVGPVGIGTTTPQGELNLNNGNSASSDTLLVGNNSTKGVQLRDTGNAVDLESIGVPLFVNFATFQPTFLFNSVGIGTSAPQAELNLNSGGTANADTLLLGNNTSRGLQLRDNGNGMDLESIGVPLNVNFVTKQTLFLNPNGGEVLIGEASVPPGLPAPLAVGAVDTNGKFNSAGFSNDVFIAGNLQVEGQKDFRIDHPLDPLNKYLAHASIESSEVLNQYSGNVVLDEKGEARVQFPDWFAAINEDFRYQLTAIGAPGPNLYIAEEINNNSFTIAGGKPGMKVSWQVTARRNDLFMRAHPLVVEEDKGPGERGRYSNPELYGAPAEQGIFPAHKFATKPSN